MSNYDGLIFDLDGTLWDSTDAVAEAWETVRRDLAISRGPITPRDVAAIMGLTLPQAFDRLFPHCDPATRRQIETLGAPREIQRLLQRGGLLYAGVREGLTKLRAKYPLFIVSNCLEEYLEVFYTLSGLGECFRDAETYGRTRRPKGDNIASVVARNGLRRPAYIGDTAADQAAARAAKVDFYHAAYGFGVPDQECPAFASFPLIAEFFDSLA